MSSSPAPSAADETPLDWTEDGHPRSRHFGDIYFSPEDGLAESRAVFLQGCGLPEAWAGRDRFVVGELGFGAGLNILALLELWRRTRPPGGQLSIFSIEAFPVRAQDMLRAVARWPEIADLAALLASRWPGRARGFHRVELQELNAVLDLAVMPVEDALAAWSGRADAWFLDGFSPALNPQMWSEAVMAAVAARSAPDARAATFTVAGAVRRGLQAAGFAIDKRPGYGRKRERLEARLPGPPAPRPDRPRVAVVGAGIAGASAMRALRALGLEPLLFEAADPGAGGSGNPAALVTPRLDAGLGPVAELAAQSFGRAVGLYAQTPGAVIARGVLQLAQTDRDPERFRTIAAADLFEPGAMTVLAAEVTTARLGEPAPAGLDMNEALVIAPAIVLASWLGDWRPAAVAAVVRDGDDWRLTDAAGAELWRGAAVILAAGPDTARLWPDLALTPVRGQASWATDADRPAATAWGGYLIPTADGLLFGATHDRGDIGTETRADDHARNLETLASRHPELAARLSASTLEGRAAVRATTGDHLPLAGAASEQAPGLFLLTGFGSRGFSMAPLLGEHVAARIAGAPSPLPAALADLVDPQRFERRAARRGRNSVQTRA
ncbi:tRNA (5-methylaminomethyl-2-thiouridine)(34)-methyltransferase MnmD [Phenylobacterium aquaticum]|uniref:tRNA (5-methylaminomethyl-2-thiouridine)(34)-methyltransferase MnmD n=1 Tax=Phenylobacterium aquaticum TaxID=1763816 RepID=UPI001F5D2B08|nr:tRNA (5-methylaminomethyl-2-thiouridine)(34)-methyltransferase MnmD [Phenylobacterium aquaticum]MCI3134166.1 tRNA (5-methylaminomethyl-2-thiouridine)(34)-methyltransferase MnmD [Phenylobacterium aquaticum]